MNPLLLTDREVQTTIDGSRNVIHRPLPLQFQAWSQLDLDLLWEHAKFHLLCPGWSPEMWVQEAFSVLEPSEPFLEGEPHKVTPNGDRVIWYADHTPGRIHPATREGYQVLW